ncbi:MAG: hypothetical protein FWF25_04435 [Propionibacteriaceae bacterium]|nr:hypothetical protein [Propionibacteriaceae bacterium]
MTVQVMSNTSWSVSSMMLGSAWLSVSPASGVGNGQVTLSAQPNTTTAARTATVTLTAASSGVGVMQMISVSQAAAQSQVVAVSSGDDCGSSTVSYCSWTSVDSPVSGSIETPGDKDWFRFTVPSSGTWTFTASRPATGGLSDSIGTVYLADGTTVVATDDDSAGSLQFKIQAVLTAGQVYFLEVKGYSAGWGKYTVTATRIA